MNKEDWKKFLYFFMIAAYVLGTIGGFGYSVYGGSYPVAVAILVLAYMAWPKFLFYWKAMQS